MKRLWEVGILSVMLAMGLQTAEGTQSASANALRFLGFNGGLSPLADVRVRKAIALAIDRKAVAAMVPGAEVATGIQPPAAAIKWSRAADPYPFNPDEAKRLLMEAGLGQVTLSFYAGRSIESIARKIAQDVATVGLATTITLVGSFDELAAAVKSNRVQIFLAGSFINPRASDERQTVLLWDFWSRGANFDLYRYRNPKVDDLLEQAMASRDPSQKAELYRQVEELVLADVAVVPLFFFQVQ